MVSRSKYSKVQQANGASGPYDFGHQCIYNHQLKLLFVSAPSDRYDATGANWISSGSGSVFVYSYDEPTTLITQIQKISQPNVNTNGIASKRHAAARFGQSIDTYGDWLIIGCPGDIYTEKHDGSDVVRNDQFVTDQGVTITTAGTGSVYFYKWNGATFDYVNKVLPPLYQDFSNPTSNFDSYNSQKQPFYEKYGLYCGNGSAFGSSVSVDKSPVTSYTSSNVRTRKLVAVGAPNATSSYSTAPGNFKGPFGGVWILSYDSTTLKWRTFSEKLTHYSFGGAIDAQEQYSTRFGNGRYPNINEDQDGLGVQHMNTAYATYRTSTTPVFVPPAASDARATASTFGERVSLGHYGQFAHTANHKLVVYDSANFSMQDSLGTFSRGGNAYFYDLIHTPANPEKFSLVLKSPYENRQFYIAQDKVSTGNQVGLYSDSISGYSTFCDKDAGPDSSLTVRYKVSDTSKNVFRNSAGKCTFPPVTGTTLESVSGNRYVDDASFFKAGPIGSHDIKQMGRLCFVSVTGMIRTSSKISFPYYPYTVNDYEDTYELSSFKKLAGIEKTDFILVFDLADMESLHTKCWILSPPNTWRISSGAQEWSGGYGRHFDVYQESSTEWVVASSCLADYEKEFEYPDSPVNDYIYTTKKATVKTHLYRLTYDGTAMSAVLINTVDGKIVEGGNNVFPTFENDRGYSFQVRNTNSSGYARDMMKNIGIPSGYNFICPALIKNVTRNEYHVAEGWAGDNDGSSNPYTRTGSLNLTVSESYDINPASFLAFCE